MKILVTFALDAEFSSWRGLREFNKLGEVSFRGYETRIGDAEVRVAVSGVGRENAVRAIRQAFKFLPDVCIFSGFAGSLKGAYRPGDIVAPGAVRDARTGRSLPADAARLKAAVALGAKPVPVLLMSDEPVLSSEKKRELSRVADAVDMESFASMEEVAPRKIPALVLRSISDGVEDNLPLDFSSVLDERGGVYFWRLAGQVARAPRCLPALLRLGRRCQRAAELLARFLDSYTQILATDLRASETTVEVVCG